ncbi:MAG: glutamine--fructose-6-phosphate transaminase (isomerizing) [Deltaproteobacteria bacterium]|nr:glutamine--fructose-6-phosphate transaminase (isomerizing) [Deltaproteobacteria bacterium]
MCGIIGYVGSQNPKDILLDGLKRLEYRGYDSAGVAVFENGKSQVYRCEGRLENLERRLKEVQFAGHIGIGHTRWATHGAPNETNAHPHKIGAITLVHNGIIENYIDHKEKLLKMGRSIASDTDSEIVAHLFDIEVTRGLTLLQAMNTVLPTLRGSYAFVVMSEKEPELLIGVRNGAPLLLGVGEGENYVASDAQAVLHRTRQIVYLEDHQFAALTREKISVFNDRGEPLNHTVKRIDWSPEQAEKLGYRHYMLKEIHEQANAITNTIDGNIDHKRGVIACSELAFTRDVLASFKRIAITACGTARHAGLIGKSYFERFARIPVEVDYASEFRYRNPVIDSSTLLITISQSGETADTLAALREAKGLGSKTLSICNVRDSTLARESDVVLYTNAGPEIGVASTKAFTTQLVVLYMLSVEVGLARKTLTEAEAKELTSDLVRLPMLVESVLQKEDELEKIAIEYQADPSFFFIGRGCLYPVALEGALKLKEISYIHAEGYAAGELKHGPIALIDRSTVTIALASVDTPYSHLGTAYTTVLHEKVVSNIQEVRARGGRVISLVTEGNSHFDPISQHVVRMPRATWAMSPILYTIPLQLFAYYVALQRGTDVDKPRNLAKSVTVE